MPVPGTESGAYMNSPNQASNQLKKKKKRTGVQGKEMTGERMGMLVPKSDLVIITPLSDVTRKILSGEQL